VILTVDALKKCRGDYCTFETTADVFDQLSAALERARVVGVLDEWATKHKRFPVPSPTKHGNGCFELWLSEAPLIGEGVSRCYVGDSPDAARAAAAKAIEAGRK
jgi:hypothetical protein